MTTIDLQALPPSFERPHVFILGAGASRAAFPNGDATGRPVPLMNDLTKVLNLEPLLARHGVVPPEGDFETLYSTLATMGSHAQLLYELEQRVFDYFAGLRLPDKPNLYDHLVLSLRPKDLIATFNWDPFLWEALRRNGAFAPMPQSVYLHGNVAVGYCTDHKPTTLGCKGNRCGRCGAALEPSRLLYPVTQKNYNNDPSIDVSWSEIGHGLTDAFILTIFGYRAPDTDVEAMKLIQQAWGRAYDRSLDEVEIIDIRDEDELLETWKPLICKDHYVVWNSFYDSLAAQHPRRSCEHFWEAIMECNPQPEQTIPRNADFQELHRWYQPLIGQERNYDPPKGQRIEAS